MCTATNCCYRHRIDPYRPGVDDRRGRVRCDVDRPGRVDEVSGCAAARSWWCGPNTTTVNPAYAPGRPRTYVYRRAGDRTGSAEPRCAPRSWKGATSSGARSVRSKCSTDAALKRQSAGGTHPCCRRRHRCHRDRPPARAGTRACCSWLSDSRCRSRAEFKGIELESEVLLSVVLPPLLYSAALDFSFPTFLRNVRPILGLGVGLVVVTALAVAGMASWSCRR